MNSLSVLEYTPILDDILEFCDYDLTTTLLSQSFMSQIMTEYNKYYEEVLNEKSLEDIQQWLSLVKKRDYTLHELTNLKELWLNNNNLTTLPETIGQLKNLSGLYLEYNNLTSLPETIGQLTNLKYLWLNNNNLTTLPDTIGQLTNLLGLDLEYNNLTTLHETIEQLINLDELDIDDNKLKILPKSLLGKHCRIKIRN